MAATDRQHDPPYLLTALHHGRGVELMVSGDATLATVEVTARGPWSHQRGDQISAVPRLCLAGPSGAILVDLHHLDDPSGLSLRFWIAAWRQARLGPAPVHLALCLPATAALSRRLRDLQEPGPLLFATVPDARMALARRV